MQEDFLHYIWKYKKFDLLRAKSTNGFTLTLIDTGIHNFNSGPDFFNGRVKIGDEIWAGNIEIHIKSSHWYAHGHEADPNYDNVILHVVWEEDIEIFRRDNTSIPTLELKNLVSKETLEKHNTLLLAPNRKWINCENDFDKFDEFTLRNWQERLYFERLQQKTGTILKLLQKSGNDWEKVLFLLLAKNFGLKVNGGAFLSFAESLDFKVVQKLRNDPLKLEALFFGQAGLLDDKLEDAYFLDLKKEYSYQKRKFKLENKYVERPKFFRLRPDNFPNIRLSQLASLYSKNHHLFADLIKADNLEKLSITLSVETAPYWKEHYTFGKTHKSKTKAVSKSLRDLLVINTVLPLQFSFHKATGSGDPAKGLVLIEQLKPESNIVVNKFNKIRRNTAANALQSQALIHLKSEYCDKNYCLKCSLGNILLQGKL